MKRVIAVSLSGLLAAGLVAGNVEYASHTFCLTGGTALAAQGTTKEKLDVKESGGLDSDKISKQETVYVNMDAKGKPQEVTVSDWLKNSGVSGAVKDESSLTDIENVKGEESFTQDGDTLTWQAGKKDIYYQGSTDQELPVSVELTYYLDGEEISPKELIGKSGKLEIDIRYRNKAKRTVTVGGRKTDIYIPFMMITGMILPVDIFENVWIDNGTIVSEGDNDILVAYGMPGLSESLDLDGLDFGDDMDIDSSKIRNKITDTVKIKADVKDFEMNATYTIATNQIFNELDFDDIDDFDDLRDKIDDLKASSQKLVDGSSDLQEGTEKLKNSFREYSDGVHALNDGASDLQDGSVELKKGVFDYTKGTDKLLKGVDTYVGGAKTLSEGVQAYTAGTSQLVDAVSQLRMATKELPAQYDTLGKGVDTFVGSVNQLLSQENMNTMSAGTTNLKNGIGQLDDGVAALQAGVAQINEAAGKLKKTDELDQCVAGLEAMLTQFTTAAEQYAAAGDAASAAQYQGMAAAVRGAIAYIQGGEQAAAALDAATNGVSDGQVDQNGSADLAAGLGVIKNATDKNSKETNLYTGAAALETAAQTMSGYAAQLRDSSGQLTAGNAAMKQGIGTLASSIEQMDAAAGTLVGNNEKMNEGASELIQNAPVIQKNAKKLTKSSRKLQNGASRLQNGSSTLHEGIEKLVRSTGDVAAGIAELNDGALTLKDGMALFDRKGIREIAETVNDLLDTTSELNERLSKISSASNAYTSFSGNREGMEGSVKFIMATEELQK